MGIPDMGGIINEQGALHGRLTLRTFEQDNPGIVVEESSSENLFCVNGLSQMILAMNWSAVQDQNDNMGDPFEEADMFPIYGAVGTGTTTPTASDTILAAEVARTVVVSAGTNAAFGSQNPSVTWLFLFPVPAATTIVSEAGVFLNASSLANSGSLFDHALISPTVTQATSQLLTLTAIFTWGN
jgi:hypothetical protein